MYRGSFLAIFLLGGALSIENRAKPKQLIFSPDARYSASILDFNFLNPQQSSPLVPQYNFADARNALPRYQPQFLFYGAGPGQPFLLNPGQPPNNFLFPPPPESPLGPGVIYKNSPQPGRPVFVGPGSSGGFPTQKPAFVPPIEKDAEEVPTNPARIPPFKPKKSAKKPEKIETLDETPSGAEADDLEGTQTPQIEPKTDAANPKPGHQYFFLNGQSLFNYPFSPYLPQNVNPNDVLRYSQNYPQSHPQEVPVPVIPVPQNAFFQNPQYQTPNFQNPSVFDGSKTDRNRINEYPFNFDPYFPGNLQPQRNVQQPQIQYFQDNLPFKYLQPQALQYEPNNVPQADSQQQSTGSQGRIYILKENQEPQSDKATKNADESSKELKPSRNVYRSILPLSVTPNQQKNIQIRVSTKDFTLQPIRTQEYNQYLDDIENDAVVIDAKFDDNDDAKESEAISVPSEQPKEPSLAQAEPGAIALAGPGGVAESGPRATALVGKGGMAVSSPKATAIAGPAEESEKEKDEGQATKTDMKKEKYIRQRFRGSYVSRK